MCKSPNEGKRAGECPFDLRAMRRQRRQEAWDAVQSGLCILFVFCYFVAYLAGYCFLWFLVALAVLVAIIVFS